MEAGEREGGFGLDAGSAQHPHPGRLVRRVIEDGRLADSGFAAKDQRTAAALPGAAEEFFDRGCLFFPAVEHPFRVGRARGGPVT
ncbi:hypothetical protein GCM10010470_10100 [Saccharopolyspora taberi]|uniref:Uncharacterized protein n=1 Tax=Saccharopolyspora taberi TaxID=60895 RepID=A0ABN3V5B0_9PSEU